MASAVSWFLFSFVAVIISHFAVCVNTFFLTEQSFSHHANFDLTVCFIQISLWLNKSSLIHLYYNIKTAEKSIRVFCVFDFFAKNSRKFVFLSCRQVTYIKSCP